MQARKLDTYPDDELLSMARGVVWGVVLRGLLLILVLLLSVGVLFLVAMPVISGEALAVAAVLCLVGAAAVWAMWSHFERRRAGALQLELERRGLADAGAAREAAAALKRRSRPVDIGALVMVALTVVLGAAIVLWGAPRGIWGVFVMGGYQVLAVLFCVYVFISGRRLR